jgi:hypothetical protein
MSTNGLSAIADSPSIAASNRQFRAAVLAPLQAVCQPLAELNGLLLRFGGVCGAAQQLPEAGSGEQAAQSRLRPNSSA